MLRKLNLFFDGQFNGKQREQENQRRAIVRCLGSNYCRKMCQIMLFSLFATQLWERRNSPSDATFKFTMGGDEKRRGVAKRFFLLFQKASLFWHQGICAVPMVQWWHKKKKKIPSFTLPQKKAFSPAPNLELIRAAFFLFFLGYRFPA